MSPIGTIPLHNPLVRKNFGKKGPPESEGWIAYMPHGNHDDLFIVDSEGNQITAKDTTSVADSDVYALNGALGVNQEGKIGVCTSYRRRHGLSYSHGDQTLDLLWDFGFSSSQWPGYCASFDAEQNFYIGFADSKPSDAGAGLKKIRHSDGAVLWAFIEAPGGAGRGTADCHGGISAGLDQAYGYIYEFFSEIHGNVYGLDLETGGINWSVDLNVEGIADIKACVGGGCVVLWGQSTTSFSSPIRYVNGSVLNRYDSEGNLVWSKAIGAEFDRAHCLDIDFENNIYVGGQVGTNEKTAKYSAGSATQDPAVQWEKGGGSGRVTSIACDASEFIAIGGTNRLSKRRTDDGTQLFSKIVDPNGTPIVAVAIHPGNVALFG